MERGPASYRRQPVLTGVESIGVFDARPRRPAVKRHHLSQPAGTIDDQSLEHTVERGDGRDTDGSVLESPCSAARSGNKPLRLASGVEECLLSLKRHDDFGQANCPIPRSLLGRPTHP
jgi:hypothetical protein